MSLTSDTDGAGAELAAGQREGRGRAAPKRDWTQGSILGNLLALAWPVIISNSFNMLGPTIDMIWVGRLGAASIAAIGLSAQIVTIVQALMQGIFTSLRAMVARRVGEGDEQGANHAFQQAFIVGIAFSVLIGIAGVFLSRPVLLLFGKDREMLEIAVAYSQIQFIGLTTLALRMMTESTLQASGDTRMAMWIGVSYRALHMVACPFFVLGWSIFPELGVKGAAWVGAISQGVGGLAELFILLSGRSRLRITFRGFTLDRENIWTQLKIGLPSSINQVLRSFVGIFIMGFLVPFGTLAVAAHSLGQRIESFLEVAASAMGNAAGVLSAQNLGAGKPERAEKTGWLAVTVATCIMTVISIAIFIWAEPFVRIFNKDPGLEPIAATFLRIATLSFMMMGPAAVLTNCLNQVGDTMIPLLASLFTMWAVQLPLAYFMPKWGNLGVYGVRWAIAIALTLRAIIYVIYFRTGKWKTRRV